MSPQPGLLGEQFDGPLTGRQGVLQLQEPGDLERAIEAENERKRKAYLHDETMPLFPKEKRP